MYKRILVPVDGSTTSMNGLEKAIRLSKASGARLRVVENVIKKEIRTADSGVAEIANADVQTETEE